MNNHNQPISATHLDVRQFERDAYRVINSKAQSNLEGAAYLADALDLHMADEEPSDYMQGWRWGVLCGAVGAAWICTLIYVVTKFI